MTKERVEELIKQEKVIYTSRFKKPDKFKLFKDYFVDKNKLWCLNKRIGICVCVIGLDKLFEAKEQAEWVCKTHAERTERFEPPMWEDIENYYEFHFRHHCYGFVDFVVRKNNFICIDHAKGADDLFSEYGVRADKENYEKACEIVRDLFVDGGVK